MGDNHQVYISYAWGGESERIVNELDADLQSKGIMVVRDKRDLGFKGMIRDFMQQIGRGHAVIVVISDKYLKSPNCMFELVEIARNKDFYDRSFRLCWGMPIFTIPSTASSTSNTGRIKRAELDKP